MYDNNVMEFCIITTDENECNWMMFVRKARYGGIQENLVREMESFYRNVTLVWVCFCQEPRGAEFGGIPTQWEDLFLHLPGYPSPGGAAFLLQPGLCSADGYGKCIVLSSKVREHSLFELYSQPRDLTSGQSD